MIIILILDIIINFNSKDMSNKNDEMADIVALKSKQLVAKANGALVNNDGWSFASNTNYIPYGDKVGVEIIVEGTIMDIVTSKTYAEFLGKVGGDVFATGTPNPRIRVFGFGHMVQGLNIGDYLDIANVPDIVSIKGVIAGCDNFMYVREYYLTRNPRTAIAVNPTGKSAYMMEDVESDVDDLSTPIKFIFKAILDAYNIEGVYENRKSYEGDNEISRFIAAKRAKLENERKAAYDRVMAKQGRSMPKPITPHKIVIGHDEHGNRYQREGKNFNGQG